MVLGAANKSVTVFKLMNSRGMKALEQFLPEYEGKVITDRYAAYNILLMKIDRFV